MESPEHERLAIEAYMAREAPDERVVHLEKVASEPVMGRERDVWDVHTDKGRWWVITGPTNLYAQDKFPSMDVALSFHVGLMARVEERSEHRAPWDEHLARYAEAWRKCGQAGDALRRAHEAEEFQAVGMQCRESMIAFMRAASEQVMLPPEVERPQAGNVKSWAEVLGNVVAPGDSNKEHRSYLKALARETWDLVNWVTHYTDASGYHAHLAHRATEHALTTWSIAIMVHDAGDRPRCPICGSYRLHAEWESEGGLGVLQVLVCDKCGWRADGTYSEPDDGPDLLRAPPEGDCITVDVPLYPPTSP